MDSTQVIINRRAIPERRAFSWRTVMFGYLLSRRVSSRRADQGEHLFEDSHHPWLFFLALGIMVLSCVDALLTLQLLSRGMVEVNPVMVVMMDHGTTVFVISKVTITALAILTLVALSRVKFLNYLRTGLLLTLFFCLYCCLVCYEFVSLVGMI